MSQINGVVHLDERLAQIGEKRLHIHADLFELPELARRALEAMGFADTSFFDAPLGYALQVPPIMYTIKTNDMHEFQRKWEGLERVLRTPGIKGYGEGEEIVFVEVFSEAQYQGIEFPYQVKTRSLLGPPNEEFRQTEFHLELDSNRSNPNLIRTFLEAGFYGGLFREPDGSTSLTLTMQGYVVDIRKSLMLKLIDYLNRAGGVVNGRIIEEVAIRYYLAGISQKDLPKIADRIRHSS